VTSARNSGIKKHLVLLQPKFMIGGSKTMKTTVALDAGISTASGTPYLSEFDVPRRLRTAFLSGESGAFTIQETARRICIARGIGLSDLDDWLLFQFRLPQLAVFDEVDALRCGFVESGIELAFFDPLYLSLLGGAQGVTRRISTRWNRYSPP